MQSISQFRPISIYPNTWIPSFLMEDYRLFVYFHSHSCVTSIPIRVIVFVRRLLLNVERYQQDCFFAIVYNDSGILHRAEHSLLILKMQPRPVAGLRPICDANNCQVFLPGHVVFSIGEDPNHWDWPFYVDIKIPVMF